MFVRGESMAFEWTEELLTGNAQIDREHKELLKAANEFMKACAEGRGRQEIEWAAEYLSNYVKVHFEHEEALQLESRYPNYRGHKCWHDAYVLLIEVLMDKLIDEGATLALVGAVNRLIAKVVIHIKTCDTWFAQYLQNAPNESDSL